MTRPKVALFVTCLIDIFRPRAGLAAAKLLENSGCHVVVPPQTCCGQPAYNAGDTPGAAALARNAIAALEPFDHVVVPSGSCAGMIKLHYPRLFAADGAWRTRADAVAARTHELFSFLVNVRGMRQVDASCAETAVYHDSCSALREMGVAAEPRTLLSSVAGLELRNLPDSDVCCGFGGFFSIKYPDISTRMADDKIDNARKCGAGMIVGGDLGCLLHLAGRLARRGEPCRVRHAAEILAGMAEFPALGEDER